MVKTIHIFKSDSEPRERFCAYIRETLIPVFAQDRPAALKMTLTTEAPPLSVIPFRTSAAACISVTQDTGNVRDVRDRPFFHSACSVEEALPVSYVADRPPGERTPGVCLLTLFHRKPNLDPAEFIRRWHGGHTPLSLTIHPLWNYVRNQVTASLAGDCFDGIVEEQVRKRNHLTNPMVFFGGPRKCLWNMIRTFQDTYGFINYKTMETYFCNEHVIIPFDGR